MHWPLAILDVPLALRLFQLFALNASQDFILQPQVIANLAV